jgi:hypothetical protein
MITTSGLCSLARSQSWAIASNSCSRIESLSGDPPVRSGNSTPRAGPAAPAQSSTCSRPC